MASSSSTPSWRPRNVSPETLRSKASEQVLSRGLDWGFSYEAVMGDSGDQQSLKGFAEVQRLSSHRVGGQRLQTNMY